MEDQLISFETAQLAKEKGFKLQRNPFGYVDKFYEPKTGSMRSYGLHGRTPMDKLIYASTQSLLQKWLREEYRLHINIPCLGTNIWSTILEKFNEDGTGPRWGDLGKKNYKTYEEALEAGLVEALKLIK